VGNFPNETGNGSHDDQPSKDRRKSTQAGVVGHYSPAACHDGIPRGASRSDPRSLYPSPSFGPIRGKAYLASPPITFARPAAVAELTLPSVSASLDHWQLPKRCRSKPPRIAFALVRGRADTYGQIGAQDEGIE
jgi:hypothetical protein